MHIISQLTILNHNDNKCTVRWPGQNAERVGSRFAGLFFVPFFLTGKRKEWGLG
jgi:hypothetical protein